MGRREGENHTLGELRRRVCALPDAGGLRQARVASTGGSRESAVAGGYKRGGEKGVREGAERGPSGEREREVGAVREDDSRRDQRVDLSRAERDEELDAVVVRGRGEGDCGFGH